MRELDHKVSWAPKNLCFWTVVLEKTFESPLDYKEIQPVHPKGNQSWIFIGRTDAEAETPILWPPDAKNWLIWKDVDDVKDWRREEKGITEDEMVGWHRWLSEHELEQTPGNSGEQRSLACCSSQGPKESDMTEQLNNISRTLIRVSSRSVNPCTSLSSRHPWPSPQMQASWLVCSILCFLHLPFHLPSNLCVILCSAHSSAQSQEAFSSIFSLLSTSSSYFLWISG